MSIKLPRKIYLSAGHSNRAGRDRGASGNGFIEGELTVDARNRIANQLRLEGHVPLQDGNDSILKDTLTWLRNKTTNDCIVLDMHWNAASSPAATGIEVLIPGTPTQFEVDLASAIANALQGVLGLPLRGVHRRKVGNKTFAYPGVKTELESHHGRLGWMRLTGQNILIEFCFISNPNDMQKWIANRDTACQAVAKVLADFANRA